MTPLTPEQLEARRAFLGSAPPSIGEVEWRGLVLRRPTIAERALIAQTVGFVVPAGGIAEVAADVAEALACFSGTQTRAFSWWPDSTDERQARRGQLRVYVDGTTSDEDFDRFAAEALRLLESPAR